MNSLVVDDDIVNRKLLQSILKNFGECHLACNGGEAISAFETAMAADTPYDLVTLDVMMPDMDGKEVLKAIRNLEKTAALKQKPAKVLMVTGMGDVRKIMNEAPGSGDYEGFIIKPLNRQQLILELKQLGLTSAA